MTYATHICVFDGKRVDGPYVAPKERMRCDFETSRGRCAKDGIVGVIYRWGACVFCEKHAIEEAGPPAADAAPNVAITEVEEMVLENVVAGGDPVKELRMAKGKHLVEHPAVRKAVESLIAKGLLVDGKTAIESVRKFYQERAARPIGGSP